MAPMTGDGVYGMDNLAGLTPSVRAPIRDAVPLARAAVLNRTMDPGLSARQRLIERRTWAMTVRTAKEWRDAELMYDELCVVGMTPIFGERMSPAERIERLECQLNDVVRLCAASAPSPDRLLEVSSARAARIGALGSSSPCGGART